MVIQFEDLSWVWVAVLLIMDVSNAPIEGMAAAVVMAASGSDRMSLHTIGGTSRIVPIAS